MPGFFSTIKKAAPFAEMAISAVTFAAGIALTAISAGTALVATVPMIVGGVAGMWHAAKTLAEQATAPSQVEGRDAPLDKGEKDKISLVQQPQKVTEKEKNAEQKQSASPETTPPGKWQQSVIAEREQRPEQGPKIGAHR